MLCPKAWAERPTLTQEQSISLQFVARLFSLLQEVSPEQSKLDREFEGTLREVLAKAQSIRNDLHRAKQGGMFKQNQRERNWRKRDKN